MTRTRTFLVFLLTLAVAAIAVPSINAAPTCTISWTGGAGTSAWGTAGNWNQDRVPGSGDDVCIDLPAGGTVVMTAGATVKSVQGSQALRIEGGTLTVTDDPSADTTIAALEQTGGAIDGAGTLFVAGNYSWSGGSLGGSNGLIDVKGQTHISGNVSMAFDRELKTAGGSWTAGQIYGRNNTFIRNTGTFTVSDEAAEMRFENWSGTPATFINEGTLVKPAGTGTTTIGWRIDNDGLVNATSGTLTFTGGAAGSTGQFQSPGAEMKWAGGTFLMDAGSYDGVELTGGRIEIPADTTYSGGDLTISGGAVGGTGTLESTGTLTWTGGALEDTTGLLRSTGFMRIDGNVSMAFNHRLETDDGEWLGGQIYSRNNTLWTNKGTFEMHSESGAAVWSNWSGAPPKLHNLGTITRTSGAGKTTFGWAVENDGTIRTDVGRLAFEGGGGVSNGNFASEGAGRTVLAAGTFNVGNSTAPYDGFELSGGRLDVEDGQTFSGLDLWQSGGVIGGTGTLASSGTFTWTGGDMDNTGLTKSTGFTRIDGSVSMAFNHRLQTHDGEWLSGQIYSRNNTLWTNTGTFDMRSETAQAVYSHWSGAAPKIVNTGTIVKTSTASSPDSDDTIVGWALENDGVIRTDAGRLVFNGGGGESNGNFASEGTGRTVLNGGHFFLGNSTAPYDGFEVAGSAEVDVVAGATFSGADLWQSGGTIGGPGTLATGGTFVWTGGNQNESGLTRSTGFTRINGNVAFDFDRNIETKDGEWLSGQIYSRNNTTWTNTGSFELRAEGAIADYHHWSGAQPRIVNTGTFTKTAGTGNTDLEFDLTNDGTVRTETGRIRFTEGGDQGESNGNFASDGDGRTTLQGGRFVLGESATPYDGFEVAGTGEVDVVSGTFTGKDLWQSGGTIGGAGTLVTTGTFIWTGGNMNETGTTKSTGFTRINGNVAFDFDRTLETKDGEWLSGQIYSRNNTLWRNTGTFELRAEDAVAYYHHWSGAQPKIVNDGTFTKTAGTGNTDLQFALENDGTIRTSSGRIRFTGGGTGQSTGDFASEGDGRTTLQAGTFVAGNGTFDGFEVAGTARLNLADDATYAGVDLWQSGGAIGGAGTITSSGTFTWTGGSMDGPGATRSTGFTRINGDVSLEFDRTLETKDGEWLTGTFYSRNNTLWRNTGAFAMRSTGDIVHNNWSGGPPRLHNTGQITRSNPDPAAVAEDLHVAFPVDNDGSITSSWGTIRLNAGGFGVSTGTFGARLSGNFTFGKGANFAPGGELAGGNLTLEDGADIDLPGGNVNGDITGNADIRVPSGQLRWSSGTIRGNGVLHVAKGASLLFEGAGTRYLRDHRVLQNEGDLVWQSGTVQVLDGATLLNEGTLEVASEDYDLSAGGGTPAGKPAFVNTGTIVKKTGTGDSTLHNLDNRGVLDIRSGRIYAYGYRQTAVGRVIATLGGTVRGTSHAGLDLNSPRGLAGKLSVRLADGYTPATGDAYSIVYAGNAQSGTFTAETLTLPGGGTLTPAVSGGNIVYTAAMPAAAARAAAQPVVDEEAPEVAPLAPDAADLTVRLVPGAATAITVPEGLSVQVLTPTKRASVRFDSKARKLRVKLRRGARGKRLKLRYRVVAADGQRSRVATLTVKIARAR